MGVQRLVQQRIVAVIAGSHDTRTHRTRLVERARQGERIPIDQAGVEGASHLTGDESIQRCEVTTSR